MIVKLAIILMTSFALLTSGVDVCEKIKNFAEFKSDPALMTPYGNVMGTFTGRYKAGPWASDLPFIEIAPLVEDSNLSIDGYLGHVPPLCYAILYIQNDYLWINDGPINSALNGWPQTSSVKIYLWCQDKADVDSGSSQVTIIQFHDWPTLGFVVGKPIKVECLSYCSLKPITYSDTVFPDMTALFGQPKTYIVPFDRMDVSTEASCTVRYKFTCIAGCTTVPSHSITYNSATTQDSITWNADTAGTFTLELRVFYNQYVGKDETGNFVQQFELTVVECFKSPIQNSGVLITQFTNYFSDQDYYTIPAFTGGHEIDPDLCELEYILIPDTNSVVTFDESQLKITILASDEAMIWISTFDTLEVQYKNYPALETVKFYYNFEVDILSICTRDVLLQSDPALTEIYIETEVDTPTTYDLASMWTNPGIVNSPIDCELMYNFNPTTYSSFLYLNLPSPEIILSPIDWADVGEWTTQLEVKWNNYPQTVPDATIPIRVKVTPNCREQLQFPVKVIQISTQMYSYSYYSIEATSDAIVNAPIDCVLNLSIDVSSFPSWADQSMITLVSQPPTVATFEMTVTTDDTTITNESSIGSFTLVLSAYYVGFPDFDPLSAADKSIQIDVEPICAQVTTFNAQDIVNIYPKYQYIIGDPALVIGFQFDLDPIGCFIHEYYTIKVDGVQDDRSDIFTLDQANGQFLVENQDMANNGQVFKVTITGFLQTRPYDTKSIFDLNYNVFIVENYDFCLYGIFERSPDRVLPDIEYDIYDGISYTEPLSPFSFNETSCNYNVEYLLFPDTPNFITFDSDAMEFIVSTNQIGDLGQYQINIVLRLDNDYPFNAFIEQRLSFNVDITSSCISSTIAFNDSSASAISKIFFLSGTEITIDATSNIQLLDTDLIPLVLGCGPLIIQGVSLSKRTGYKIDATSNIVNNEIECCGTSNTNDYGFYDLEFTTTLSHFLLHTPQTLEYEVEIIPDCSLYTVYTKTGYEQPIQISAQFGVLYGIQGSLDLSNAFSHQFQGHYGNYCGELVVNLPTTTTSQYSYLSIDIPTSVITSLPTDISHRSDIGDITDVEVYLLSFHGQDNGQNFQLQTQVLLYCELTKLEALEPEIDILYQINSSANIPVDMQFNNLDWTSNSWLPECNTERLDELHFSFEGRAIDYREGFFYEQDSTTSFLQSTNAEDQGQYVINVWLKTYLPSQTYAYSTKNTTININMNFNPCFTSHIEDDQYPNWNYNWEYEISPFNGQNYSSYDLPYFTNDVSRLMPGFHCGDIQYSLGTSAELLQLTDVGVEIEPRYITEENVTMQAIDFRAVKLHNLHNESYLLTLTVNMKDYPGIEVVQKKISLTIKSACEFTELQLLKDIDDENYQKLWYTQGSDLFLLYQIGQPIFEFEALVADTVSLQSPFEDLEPFCGERIFTLTCSDTYSNDTLKLVDSSVTQIIATEPGEPLSPSLITKTVQINPTLSILTNEMQIVNEDFNQVLGYYGNHILDDDPSLLVQEFSASLTAKVNLPFIDKTKIFTINSYIVNKCDKVFLYKEESTQHITIGVQQEAKTLTIGSYISYLDYVIYTTLGFSEVQQKPLCGIPHVELQCMLPGAVATSISSVEQIDLSLFTEEFSTSLNNPANYFVEIPEFLQVSYQTDGSTTIVAEASTDIWDPEPYVCLINANINPPSQIAVPNDFLIVNVLPLDYASINQAPQIIGLDQDYTVQYGGTVADSFTITDDDIVDIGQLKATVAITGTEITKDCGCVSFEAEYQTIDGERGTETSLDAALRKNKILQSISVQFIATPTQEMINKRYELTITLSDTFASVQKSLVINTEGTEEEEILVEEESDSEFKFAGVIIDDEDSEQTELKEEEDQLAKLKQFLSQNADIFRGGTNPTEEQFSNVKTKLLQSDLPIPYVNNVDTEGFVQIYISQEILLPNKNDIEAFVRHITFLYAIEITLESQDLVIRGEPQIASQYSVEPQTNRTLQENTQNGQYLTDWSPQTEQRFKDFSSPNDENEEIIFNSKKFKWSITNIEEQSMTVQLDFEKPEMISTYGSDVLNFYANIPEIFLTRPAELFSGEQDWGDIRLRDRRNVPKQKAVSLLDVEAGSVGLQLITIVNVVLASFMQMSLDELWNVLNSLSFIVYLPLFTFIYPENCQTLMKSFLAVVTFDLIETLQTFGIDIIPWEYSETPPFNERFEELGYEDSNTLSLLGTVNILILFMTIILLLSVCVKICKPCHRKRFGRYVRRNFTFRGQLSTLNQLIISGSLELLVCSIVNVVPSTFDQPILTQQNWSELETIDRIALVYGIVILVLFSLMIIIYFLMLSYMAPKLAFLAQQDELKVYFISRITAYRAALKDIEQKRLSQQQDDIEPKNIDLKVKESKGQQNDDQLEIDSFMSSPEKSLQTSNNLLMKDQSSVHNSNLQEYSSIIALNENQADDKILLKLGIKEKEEPKENEDPKEAKQNIDKLALQAAGMAIRIEKPQQEPEESSVSFEFGAEKEKIMDEEVKNLKQIVDQNQENFDAENYELFRKDSSFKFLYASVINYKESEIIIRIDQLVEINRLQKKRGRKYGKLTHFQKGLRYYFGGILDGIDQRNISNFYYLPIYLARRIIFVFTAIYLSDKPQIQMMLTYNLCLLMLAILAGSQPHQSKVKNRLETINEAVVLILLMLSWMMLIIIMQVIDPEEAQELYNNFGLAFSLILMTCIVLNFLRIICQMCGKARQNYTRKLRISMSKATQYDNLMNFVPGYKKCDCKCYQCSNAGYIGKLNQQQENWDPIEPRWFKIRPLECPYDDEKGWINFFLKQQENKQPLQTKQESKVAFKGQKLLSKNKVDRIEEPENEMEGIELEFQRINNESLNKKRVRFEIEDDQKEKAASEVVKKVRFADELPLEIETAETNNNLMENYEPIKLIPIQSNLQHEQSDDNDDEEDSPAIIQDLDSKMRELQKGDRAGIHQTKQMRHRRWVREESFSLIESKTKTKQAKLRQMGHLDENSVKSQSHSLEQQLQYGE